MNRDEAIDARKVKLTDEFRQIFANHFDTYADSEEVVPAMTRDEFVKQAIAIYDTAQLAQRERDAEIAKKEGAKYYSEKRDPLTKAIIIAAENLSKAIQSAIQKGEQP